MIRRFPPTTRVGFPIACRLSRVGLRQCIFGGVKPRLALLQLTRTQRCLVIGDGLLDLEMRIPDRENRLRCKCSHCRAIRLHSGQGGLAVLLPGKAVIPPSYDEADGQSLDVPLEGAGPRSGSRRDPQPSAAARFSGVGRLTVAASCAGTLLRAVLRATSSGSTVLAVMSVFVPRVTSLSHHATKVNCGARSAATRRPAATRLTR